MGLSSVLRTVLFTGFVAAVAAHPSSGQVGDDASWGVRSVDAAIDLTAGDGSASVRVDFVLVGKTPVAAPPPREPVSFDLLGFDDASVDAVTMNGDESIVLWPTVGSHKALTVYLPEVLNGNSLPVTFAYRVVRAVEDRDGVLMVRVPLLNGPTAPLANEGGDFNAEVRLPENWSVTDAFPSGLRSRADGVRVVSLPVVPAVVRFRARTDGRWRPGVPLLFDVLTVLILVGFATFGWRHLREVAA